jgi:diguanylate cyclase (GGDEF)-like protein
MRANSKNGLAKVVSLQPNRYGIPVKEMTPHVRMALAALEQKIEALHARVGELADLADRDPLIPVLNRRAFLEALQRTTAFVQRYGGDAAVIYIDLDAFKSINDNFGHPTGDAVLRHVGRVLLESVRETDMVGRIGGDEFAVILAQSNLEDAKRKAAKLQAAISAAPCVHEGLEHIVSASFGVHPIARTEDAEAALARADEAMYANKKRVRAAV